MHAREGDDYVAEYKKERIREKDKERQGEESRYKMEKEREIYRLIQNEGPEVRMKA